ncbi:MAG: glycosyltransferase [Deltaproteobacteria bacterium]|nr:glycosyltransferase [Deltaproteobacteria bacterium]
MSDSKIRICFFPGRESSYVRSRVLAKGLTDAGAILFDCSYVNRSKIRYIIGFWRFLKYKAKCDIIFIGFFGQFLVPLVRLFTRKPIVFDTFLSAYQTLAYDRKSIRPNGLMAWLVRRIERLSCQCADVCLVDTYEQIKYFLEEYGLPSAKFHRSFLSADDSIEVELFSTAPPKPIVHFHGEFQALHGAKVIIAAAQIVQEAHFRLVGGGRELKEAVEYCNNLGLSNVEFIPFVPYNEIPNYIAKATVCLGIFGDTQKAQLVVPFKVYETLAMGQPILTADTPAIRELLTHAVDAYLVPAANPAALANGIRTLLANETLRKKIAENGLITFQNRCSPLIVGKEILSLCETLRSAAPRTGGCESNVSR